VQKAARDGWFYPLPPLIGQVRAPEPGHVGAVNGHPLLSLHDAPADDVASGPHRRVKGMHAGCRHMTMHPGD